MTKPVDQREREDLCALLREIGPDAPTLCQGWNTFDLAIHLVLRDHLRRWTRSRMAKERERGFDHTLTRLETGPPFFPWRIPGTRTRLNAPEFFIHHEDTRRANGYSPRTGRPDLEDLAWRTAPQAARQVVRALNPFGLFLQTTRGATKSFGHEPRVQLSGPATELLLFLSGRRSAALVEVSGSREAQAKLTASEVTWYGRQ